MSQWINLVHRRQGYRGAVTVRPPFSGPSTLLPFDEVGHHQIVEVLQLDLSTSVFDALDVKLPNEGRHLVRRVDVIEGWGYIHYVKVYSGLRRHDASAGVVEEAIRAIVANVLHPRRNVVRIVWAT
jgi:hypothetical protein